MIILINISSWSWSSSSSRTSSSCAQFLEARVASNEEGNLYVDITELRMDQVIVLISPVLLYFDAWAISYQWQLWIKMLTIQFSSTYFQLTRSSYFTLDPQTYITYYHNWLRMAVIGILPFSAICCLNLRIFLAVRSKPKICWWKNIT